MRTDLSRLARPRTRRLYGARPPGRLQPRLLVADELDLKSRKYNLVVSQVRRQPMPEMNPDATLRLVISTYRALNLPEFPDGLAGTFAAFSIKRKLSSGLEIGIF